MSTEWVVVPVEALRVAEQTCDIASDWHLPDVDVKVPAEWGVPCNEEGWPTTHGLAMYFRGLAARPTGPDVPKLLVPRTEAEWRGEFEKVYPQLDKRPYPDQQIGRNAYLCNETTYRWWGFLAALRLVGAIKEDGK